MNGDKKRKKYFDNNWRAQSMKTGKIKEFAYKQDIACRDRIRSMLETHEMTICTDEIIGCINYDPTAD